MKQPPLDHLPAGLVASSLARVRAEGAVPLKKLITVKLSKAAEAQFFDELGRSGLERTGKHVRVPLRDQLAALLAAGPVPTRGLKQRLRGLSSAAELTHLIKSTIAERTGQLVQSGGQEALVDPGRPVVSTEERRAIEQLSARLGKLLRGAGSRSLLRDDVAGLLAPFSGFFGGWLRQAIAARITDERPFVFVPELARDLSDCLPPPKLADELLRGAGAGYWELRPESGVGLLAPEDAALCPKGWGGEVLSYVRPRS